MSSACIVPTSAATGADDDGTPSEGRASRVHRPKFLEKRKSSRYPVHQDLQYRVVDHKEGASAGAGLTLDMSGSGIRFSIQEGIQIGRVVEVSVDWPVRLDGTCPMKVVVVGRVVRSEAHWAALSILRYEFRTRGSGLAQGAALPRDGADATRSRDRTARYRKSPVLTAAS
jgi:hypothetical protein